MQLVERHIIKITHASYKECDMLAFLSKNLYNQALYRVRQYFFDTGKYLSYYTLQKQLQNEKQIDYISLPAKVSQQVLRQVDQNFRSFFKALKTYQKNPNKFKARPKLPSYKHKTKGRNIVTYTNQAISKVELKKGFVKLSKTNLRFKTKQTQIQQVRIIPRLGCYVMEVVYEKQEKEHVPNGKIAAIDIGLNNLATTTFNFEQQPIIYNGKPLKAINQFFNKKRAELMANVGNKGTSKKIKKLTFKRNNKINDYLHKTSRQLINHLVSLNASTLVIGWNEGMKQDINIGKRNNQNFVNIPFKTFIEQLKYKGKLEGIKVTVREESYTSKCSFLDREPIKKHEIYKGKRVKRGLFRTGTHIYLNADVNASYNIMTKEFPNAFADGIEGVVVHPMRTCPYKQIA